MAAQELVPLLAAVSLLVALGLCWRQQRPFWRRARVVGFLLLVGTFYSPQVLFAVYPSSHDRETPTVPFRLPLDGPVTVAWGGGRPDRNYHVASPDQRWAYDLLVTCDGKTHRGEGMQLTDYYCYGLPVRSPAAGVVYAAKDGQREWPPGATSNDWMHPGGNQVVLEVGRKQYLFLCHLQPGSLRVKAGERVKAGQILGLVGNSGNTSEPHVHIHLQDTPEEGWGEGIPLPFWNYRLAGRVVERGIPTGGEQPQVVEQIGTE